MIDRDRIAKLCREHEELTWLAYRIKAALYLAAKHDLPGYRECLAELRTLAHEFNVIVSHCHADGSVFECTDHKFLTSAEHARIGKEHEEIFRYLAEFRENVRFPLMERRALLVSLGTKLIKRLRAHLGFEQALLARLSKTTSKKLDNGVRLQSDTQEPSISRNARTHKVHFVPYTVEPHSEL